MSPFLWLVFEILAWLLVTAALFFWLGTLTSRHLRTALAQTANLAEPPPREPIKEAPQPTETKPQTSASPADSVARSELVAAQTIASRHQQDAAKYQAEATRQSTLVTDLRADQKVLLTQIAELRTTAAAAPATETASLAAEQQAKLEAELTAAREAHTKAEALAAEQQAKLEAELTAAREAQTKAEALAAEQHAKYEAELRAAREAQTKAEALAAEQHAKLEAELTAAREAQTKAEALAAEQHAKYEAELSSTREAQAKAEALAVEQQAKLEGVQSLLTAALAAPPPSVAPERKRKSASAPRDPSIDDLTAIKGIGKVLNQRLHECGITTYLQIASWTAEDIAHFDKLLALKGRVQREEWISQALQLQQAK